MVVIAELANLYQVVDTDVMPAQLDARRIHAVLDVADSEPLPNGHPLRSAPNCLITPYVVDSVVIFAVRGYQPRWRRSAAISPENRC